MAKQPVGEPPAIVLIDPKFVRNLASTVRAAACFGIRQVWYTGSRADEDTASYGHLPRELRMKSYDVQLLHDSLPLCRFLRGTPIAVEFRDGYVPLPDFVHPEDAIYIFGPEDGSLERDITYLCHAFVTIPSLHCLNLAMAANVVLYDRYVKRGQVRG